MTDGSCLQNADFSSEAVRLGLDVESKQEPSRAMQWMQTDFRSWKDVSKLLPFSPFDSILDKSTSDAIATGAPVEVTSNTSDACPTVLDYSSHEDGIASPPVELLGLHLVPLTTRGSRWFVMSYSTMRFDNIARLWTYWKLVDRKPFEAARGTTASGAHAPSVYHWMYILERK